MYYFLKIFELLGGEIRKESSSYMYCIVRLECSRESSELTSDDPTTPTKICEAVELTFPSHVSEKLTFVLSTDWWLGD